MPRTGKTQTENRLGGGLVQGRREGAAKRRVAANGNRVALQGGS